MCFLKNHYYEVVQRDMILTEIVETVLSFFLSKYLAQTLYGILLKPFQIDRNVGTTYCSLKNMSVCKVVFNPFLTKYQKCLL